MNRARRRELAKVVALIEEAKERLEMVIYEEQEALDNMPEGLQQSERGEAMEEYISTMAELLDTLDADVLQEIVDS